MASESSCEDLVYSDEVILNFIGDKCALLKRLKINDDFTVEVSFRFGGTEVDALLDYHKKEIRLPRNPSNYPDKRFLAWQKEELFRA